MSASALLKKARQAGISFTVADSKLRLEADDEPPAELVEAIIRQKTEIIALISKDALEERNGMASDSVPERYLDAWGQFQCQCPGGVTEQAWRQAIDDAGKFFDQCGSLAVEFGWTPGDLFDVALDDAAGETCPAWPGQPMTAHWGIEDPAAVEGTNIEKERAFAQAFRYLRNRITVFIALPIRSLDQVSLANRLKEIGRMEGASHGEKASS
jgi:hypothetical protein